MKIYRPVKLNLLCQLFGAENTYPSVMPLYKSLGLLGHNGFDFTVSCKDNQAIHGGMCESVYMNVIGADLTVSSFQIDDKYGYGINAVDEKGNKKGFPYNPNGSVENIAGICDKTGRVFGLMPHPERHISFLQHPRWTREMNRKRGDGFAIFKSGVDFARKHL